MTATGLTARLTPHAADWRHWVDLVPDIVRAVEATAHQDRSRARVELTADQSGVLHRRVLTVDRSDPERLGVVLRKRLVGHLATFGLPFGGTLAVRIGQAGRPGDQWAALFVVEVATTAPVGDPELRAELVARRQIVADQQRTLRDKDKHMLQMFRVTSRVIRECGKLVERARVGATPDVGPADRTLADLTELVRVAVHAWTRADAPIDDAGAEATVQDPAAGRPGDEPADDLPPDPGDQDPAYETTVDLDDDDMSYLDHIGLDQIP